MKSFSNIKEYFDKSEKKIGTLSISLWLMCKNLICNKLMKDNEIFFMKLFNKSQEIINTKMDMIHYLKNMQELINMKYLLFNDIHCLCLGFFKKPKIYEKNQFVKDYSRDYKKLAEIINYYEKKKNYTSIDLKIFDLLSDEIKSMILEYK